MTQGFTVEVVRVKGHVNWAIKAIVDGVSRYRGYYYKKEAIVGLEEWERYHHNPIRVDIFRAREFMHNFNSAEELNLTEDTK